MIFTFRTKIGHLAPLGPLGGFGLDLPLSTHVDFQKTYNFPIDFVKNAIYDHLFRPQVGSKSAVLVDAKNAPGLGQTHNFAFLSLLRSIEL